MKYLIMLIHMVMIFLSGRNILSGHYGYQLFIFFYSISNLVNILVIKKRQVLSTKIWSVIILLIPGTLLAIGPLLKIVGRLFQSKSIGSDWTLNMVYAVAFLSIGFLVYDKSSHVKIE